MNVSKYIFLLAFLFVALGNSLAQDGKFKRELDVGASFGMNFSSVSFSPKVDQKMLQAYNGGLILRWITEKHLGLQAEVNFTQQGWEEEFEEQPQYQYSRTINFIEIPFLTHIYFGSDRFRFFVNLGPKIGYALGESTSSNLDGAEPNKNNEQHNLKVQKKFDWGLCGGPGIELRTGIGHFILEGRYYYALGDLMNSTKSDPFAKSSIQNISAKVAYLFRVK